ncbi:MAG: hypothetical protein EXS37_15905 [Opitutus sp.]|nr:hypothetical protein [Opitutus sp.]
MKRINRRGFIKTGGIAAIGALAWRLDSADAAGPSAAAAAAARQKTWVNSLSDPFRESLLQGGTGRDFPERVRKCAEPLRDKPAFDPEEVARLAAAVRLPAAAKFEHPMLERVVRVGLAHIDLTFQRDHPKYGIGKYAWAKCDGFPPVIIAAVDALTLWGNFRRAEELMAYWLRCFIFRDGSIIFQGPSLAEYGQLLTTIRQLVERSGNRAWFENHRPIVRTIIGYLEGQMLASGRVELLKGVPEDDTRQDPATYFHNNAWLVRGLRDWAVLDPEAAGERMPRQADQLLERLLGAIRDRWPQDPDDWWLPSTVEDTLPNSGEIKRPVGFVTENRIGKYTNYRYWLELLSSGVLPREMNERLIRSRHVSGGQFLGMTRLGKTQLDDWPLYNWLDGLWQNGRHDDFKLSLWGHIFYHQAEGHLTAYEVIHMPPGRQSTPYCLPCQLVAVRAAAKLALA